MTEHQHSGSSDSEQYLDGPASARPRLGGSIERWGDGLRMIAVTAERIAVAGGSAESAGYLPTVPADSEEPALD